MEFLDKKTGHSFPVRRPDFVSARKTNQQTNQKKKKKKSKTK